MKYVDEFRDGDVAKGLAAAIAAEVRSDRRYNFMEFCGGHTHAIARYGVPDLLPANVRMIHGPGCPVCVLPIGRIDLAIHLALERGVILCTYADTLRVPASGGLSLMRAKAIVDKTRGDIRMVYAVTDALKIARDNPGREVVFFAIGFETTTPPTAVAIRQARAEGLNNFSVLCCHVLTPSAIMNILESPEVRELGTVPLDGFIGPAHVSTVIGSRPYEFFAEEYRKPVVIAGFEPLDVMQAILMLVRQVNEGRIPPCASARSTPSSMPSDATVWNTARCRTTRPASVGPSCAASRNPPTARSSARSARRRRPWGRAWCRRRAPARPITLMGGTRTWRRNMRRDEALGLLNEASAEIRGRFGVKQLRLFGSTARDEAREDSDVDILVEFDGPATFDGYFDLLRFLEARMGCAVDLVTEKALKDRMRPFVEKDAIHVP